MYNRHQELIVHSFADSMMDRRKAEKVDELFNIMQDYLKNIDGWELKPQFPWLHLKPSAYDLKKQGWKIHISATRFSAANVLKATLPILLEEKVQFKTTFSVETLITMNEAHYPRGNSGKFMTIYPTDDEQFKRLVKKCHNATLNMEGPKILSDKAYQQGSLVSYRYGAFQRMEVLKPDGDKMYIIYTPDNNPVEDLRYPYYNPPNWAINPIEDSGEKIKFKDKKVLLNNRFIVKEAIRHANKGGVYIGTDLNLGKSKVIIKEARPHVATDRNGNDACYYLENEFRKLTILEEFRTVPKTIDFFQQGTNTFLVQEFLEGETLRSFIKTKEKEGTLTKYQYKLVANIISILRTSHRNNLIIRDFNPNNIMVLNEECECKHIDLEYAYHLEDSEFSGVRTPGYTSDEQIKGGKPVFLDDIYSLGATLFFIFTARDPYFMNDDIVNNFGRTNSQKIEEYVELLSKHNEIPRSIANVIKNSMHVESEKRWDIDKIMDEVKIHAENK